MPLPYADLAPSCARVLIRGTLTDVGQVWQTRFDYAMGAPVAVGNGGVVANSVVVLMDSSLQTAIRNCLATNSTYNEIVAYVKDSAGGVSAGNLSGLNLIGTMTSTGNKLPGPVSAVWHSGDGFIGRSHVGRNYWPVGNGLQLDSTHPNKLSGSAHTSYAALNALFRPPAGITDGVYTWYPIITHPGQTYSYVTTSGVAELVSWRRSRKVGVGL